MVSHHDTELLMTYHVTEGFPYIKENMASSFTKETPLSSLITSFTCSKILPEIEKTTMVSLRAALHERFMLRCCSSQTLHINTD